MALPFYNWSRTAASNATADSTVNWAEGQSPSSVNDSARAMMASTAAYRDDTSAARSTGGTSTAYTYTSFQVFDTLAHMDGQVIAFNPHATNNATVTLNVDGLGAKALRSAPGVELLAGTIIQGTPYAATYYNATGEWILHGFYGNPYNIPLGASVDFWGSSAPNSSLVLAYGQAISRTVYSGLFSLLSTTYGTGDGSTTFNIPDIRGRVIAGKDDMGGSAAGVLTGSGNGFGAQGEFPTTLGARGGGQSQTLTLAQLPTGITSPVTVTSNISNLVSSSAQAAIISYQAGGTLTTTFPNGATITVTTTATAAGTATSNNTGGTAHPIVQPTIIANKLIRII